MFSDQNFVPTLAGNNETCIHVVRLENATLHELGNLANEIFENVTFPEGSILMFGTASYLAKVGTSIYASEWTEVVSLATAHWRGVCTCPLAPLILSESPGSIVQELSELVSWYEHVYDANPQGLQEVWLTTVAAMEASSTGMTKLDVMETYKVPMPASLDSGKLDTPFTFCSNNSRPVTYLGLSKDRCSEFLGSLLTYIFDNFRACSSPESYLARVDENSNTFENQDKNIFLFGASNLRQSLSHFKDKVLQFEHHTVPGWMATQENISLLAKLVESRAGSCAAFVFDLFGNSTVCFEQYDGATALPFRSDRIFHLGGKIVTTPPEI